MNKALFSRKPVNLDELIRRTGEENEKVPFVIEKVVELSDKDFNKFSENLYFDYNFIEENMELMFVDANGIWHCILVKPQNGMGSVLCEAEGYGYCRYASYIPDCTALLKEMKTE